MPLDQRRALLAQARLYLVCDVRPGGRALLDVLPAAIAGGVDIVQLRDKRLDDQELAAAARAARELCERLGVLLIVNDRPAPALAAGAHGVHVGQEDMSVEELRRLAGPDMLIGLSTHLPAEIDSVSAALADYLGVGPVYATPTKPGRPAVGLELVRHAAAHAPRPFFAIGGIDSSNIHSVLEAGATRLAVVRAIAEALDPEASARALRQELNGRLPGAELPRQGSWVPRQGSRVPRQGSRLPQPSRGQLRDEEARAALEPLADGEWPGALLLAIALALLLAVAVAVSTASVHDLNRHGGSLPGAAFLALVLLALAGGMYRRRYWAVLGFEALLAFQVIVTSLALVVASTVVAAVLCLLSILLGGWLFWKLVGVMSRIQAPGVR